MRRIAFAVVLLGSAAPALTSSALAAQSRPGPHELQAQAPDPVGEWTVASGLARITIENCGDGLWGVVSWEQRPGGRDLNNPDPGKRERPTLGMPILLDMKPDQPGRWSGEVYNSQNGKTYDAHISLLDPDTLKIEGCVLGFLCGGENWTRYTPPPETANARAPGASKSTAATKPASKSRATGSVKSTTPPASTAQASEVCSSVPQTTGSSHQRGLK